MSVNLYPPISVYTICALKKPPFSFYVGARVSEWAIKKPPKQGGVEESLCQEAFGGHSPTCLFYKLTLKPQITIAWCVFSVK